MKETDTETLTLSVQARDALIFDQDTGPIPGCVHSNNLVVLSVDPLGPVTRVIHPGSHEGCRVRVTVIHTDKVANEAVAVHPSVQHRLLVLLDY